MFSGEIRRNFIASFFAWTTNVVQASGGAVHLYFDVWSDPFNLLSGISRDLALTHPNTKAYVEETFEDHERGLRKEHPWLYEGVPLNNDRARTLQSHYGQMRKMWRAFNLVRASGIQYTLVVRGRPDATILEPLDLRSLHIEMSRHRSVRHAQGHFIAIPERDTYSTVTDVFAVGTMESIAAFASPPTAFTQATHEPHIMQNLQRHGFTRLNRTFLEEIMDPLKEYLSVSGRTKHIEVPEGQKVRIDLDESPWQLIHPDVRSGKFSPLISTVAAFQTLGDSSCARKGAACIPIYRLRFTFTLYMAARPWFSTGAVCFPNTAAFSMQTVKFLVAARIGVATSPNSAVAQLRADDLRSSHHCLIVPGLARAHSASVAFACAHISETGVSEAVFGGERRLHQSPC
jgi:hypothetical protein